MKLRTGRVGDAVGSCSRRARLRLTVCIVAGVVALGPTIASANEFAQLIFTPHFSLANPGARSLGLGGAFVALADDATAALANPAGLVQLSRPEVSIEGTTTFGPKNRLGYPPGTVAEVGNLATAKYPDSYGLGVAFRSPGGRWTAALEWDRITYSQIPESVGLWDQTVDDGDEIHVGGEYVFLGSKPLLALRAGAWLDPDHALRATSDNPYTQALLPPMGDKMHYAFGFGVAFDRFQLDGAVDLSELVDTISLSAIFSF